MKKLAYIFAFLFISCADSYREFKLEPLPYSMNTIYLKDSLRYLSLTVAQQGVLNATFFDSTIATPVILQFPKEGIRVLIIKDNKHFVQTVNIVATHNTVDLFKAHNIQMVKTNLFTFPINAYFYKIYKGIRREIITNLDKHYTTRINTLGSTSAYGLMLAIEMSALEIPLESIVSFGSARFASQDTHDQLKESFGSRLVNISHEDDVSHKLYMGRGYAEYTRGENLVCEHKICNAMIYTLENMSLNTLSKHTSNFPHTYAQMYHDSILFMEEDENRKEKNLYNI